MAIIKSVIATITDAYRDLKFLFSIPSDGKGDCGTGEQKLEVFCFSGRCGTTVQRLQGFNRHMKHDGFWRNLVARGCRSQDGRRTESGAPVDRLQRCTDAVAPESFDASRPE